MEPNDLVSRKITIEDIALQMGCSKTTVSRAISGKGRISPQMRERVLQCCRKNGYKPNVIAKSLAMSQTYNIGVILPADQDLDTMPFFQQCLLGVCEMAQSMNYATVVTTVEAEEVTGLQEFVENKKVDGVILTRSLLQDKAIAYLKTTEMPFVVAGSSLDKEVLQIDNNHVEACRELTSLLIGRNMQRIALIGGNSAHTVSQKRYRGYLEGFELNHRELHKELVYLDCKNKLMVDQAVSDCLDRRADCILCMDDKICLQVLQRLNEEKVMVPRDIRIASFYDSVFLSCYNPPITVLKFDERTLGSASCRLLLDKMSGKEVPRKTLLEYDIVLKASTPAYR